MNNQCKKILNKLEDEGKIKISSFEFPKEQELKVRLKDVLEENVEEKYYLSDAKISSISGWKAHQKPFERVQGRESVCPTLTARGAGEEHSGMVLYSDKLEGTTNLQEEITCERIGGIFDEGESKHQAGSIWDKEGLSPTLDTMQGGWRQPCVVEEPKIITHNIKQQVSVRKYEVDIEGLKKELRSKKEERGITNKEIADRLSIPLMQVEHYFRTDSSFAIPDKDIWLKLKEILGISTNEFDASIMEFEEREGVYEKGNRVYDEKGIMATLTQQEEKIMVQEPKVIVDSSVKPSVAKNFEREKEEIMNSDKEIYQCECESGYQDNKVGLKASPTIRESSSATYGMDSEYRIRKLTPKECWRLMGFTDAEFEKAAKVNSNTQLYKQAGNSIVVNVLEGILKNLLLGGEQE